MFAEELLSQCYSVWTPLQPVCYGLRLLSATRTFKVDCRVKLIGFTLEEGGLASSWAGEENDVTPRGGSLSVCRPLKRFGVDLLCSEVAQRWAVRRISALTEAKETGRGSTVGNCCRLLSTGIHLLIISNHVIAWSPN